MDVDPALAVATADGVYPPSEDTYLLLKAVQVRPGERVLDVGTGTGLLALHAARTAEVVATDVNPAAARLARTNARRNRLPLAVVVCDLLSGLRGTFDVVAFNPPYLAEPISGEAEARAWQGGETGEQVVLRFLDQLPAHLAADGRAYVILLAGHERARAAARRRFRVRTLAKERMFFEELHVLELTRTR